MRVLVLGATGKTGRQVVRALNSVDGVDVRAVSRSGGPIDDGTLVRFDWDDRTSWAPVVDGVDAVYLVDSQQSDAAQSMSEFSAVAQRAGVGHVVLLSSRDAVVSHRPGDAAVVSAVQSSGMTWTVLRPTWFMQVFSEWDLFRDGIIERHLVGTSGDGLEPFIDTRDIGDVAAAALLDAERHAGKDYQLSGPDLLTFAEAARKIGKAAGEDVDFEQMADDDFVTYLAQRRGVAGPLAQDLAQVFGWIREGRNAHVSDGVREVLGRAPRTFDDFVGEIAAQGIWRR
ncbi:NmrA family NAD(P)-binding protein [Gordonia rubripertincta]|uniref:NmrA family NAD(P)-binding protein n=1 Tax=Gordonia rubripertincta TaxID=36822 RepID=A0ABT4N1I6_GORRU|nr:NmrA family NAD(P)-binding protein [Gordonia rubripertincta]MCZ4552146.1 NmrA family NAD(P)-binding protein [Gordonia rubripertincta]